MWPHCQVYTRSHKVCRRPGVWQDAHTRLWYCEEHAAGLREGLVCAECGKPAVCRHLVHDRWLCFDHSPSYLVKRAG